MSFIPFSERLIRALGRLDGDEDEAVGVKSIVSWK